MATPHQVQLEFLPGIPLPLLRGPEHPCPYLPGRRATMLYWLDDCADATTYQWLMDRRFRRSGQVFYRPHCDGCAACIPMRVPVQRFTPSRSQRRVLRRNADVEVAFGPPVCDDERLRLYRNYQQDQHDGMMDSGRSAYEAFLVDSPIETFEASYRVDGRLVGAGIVDRSATGLSSVYFYFDPGERRRSLGVFSALCEIAECRRRGLAYWYIGYFIAECGKMKYKAEYRPHEVLLEDGCWREAPDC